MTKSFEDLLDAKQQLRAFDAQLAKSFSGIRVVCNPALEPNEYMVVCGREFYDNFKQEIERLKNEG